MCQHRALDDGRGPKPRDTMPDMTRTSGSSEIPYAGSYDDYLGQVRPSLAQQTALAAPFEAAIVISV